MFNRSRLNLAHWFALSMGSIFTVFTGALYYLQADDQLRAFDEDLYQKTKVVATKVQHQLEQGQWQVSLPQKGVLVGSEAPPPQNELIYARWYDANGQLVEFAGLQPAPQQISMNTPLFETVRLSDRSGKLLAEERFSFGEASPTLRQFTVPIKQNRVIIGYLQTATSLAPLEADLNRMLLMLTLGVPITLGAIGFTGWILGGMAMQPIRHSYERLQRFTADASHELRTPLAVVLSNIQVAMMPVFKDSEQQQQCLTEVEKAAKSMSGLLDNLLFLARHEGPITPDTLNQKTNALDILCPLISHYKDQAVEQNRTFTSDTPKQAVYLRADGQLLQRAITNLLDNAFKYTSPGGSIHLHCSTQSHYAVIQVVDNGVGIPETDLLHIFDRFYRVDVARSRQTGGFGLGLSIAQQIVQAHGGQIKVKSVFGQGTTFEIEVPLCHSRGKTG